MTLHFADGSSAVCDLLVGCDGIKSAVRGQLMRGDQAENNLSSEGANNVYPGTRFSGTVAYRALVKPDDLRAVAGEHSAITVRKMVRIAMVSRYDTRINYRLFATVRGEGQGECGFNYYLHSTTRA